MSKAYGFFSPGATGATDDFNQALKWLANNREWRPKPSEEAAIYIRLDLAANLTAEELRQLSKAAQQQGQVCTCGHGRDTHSPLCVSACGCDEFTAAA